jgi:hypothetical protein
MLIMTSTIFSFQYNNAEVVSASAILPSSIETIKKEIRKYSFAISSLINQ